MQALSKPKPENSREGSSPALMPTPLRPVPATPASTGLGVPKISAGMWGGALAAAALAGAALFNRSQAQAAERDNPPEGRFIEVDGVRLHYVERGQGRPLVLLHGNGVSLQDMEASGIMARASESYRVIAFDRPGYGYSTRPGYKAWTPREQGDLFVKALVALGIERPMVLGHSWGTMVALAMALDHPYAVSALILVSGYYYPTVRPDAVPQFPTATPLIGDVMSHTLTPLLARAMGPLQVKMSFTPAPVADSFSNYPIAMSLRPSQMRTSSIEGAIMIPAVATISGRYAELDLPVEILAGDGDRIAFVDRHSQRLRGDVRNSALRIVPGVGHMIHYTAPAEVLSAIDRAAERAPERG